MMALNISRHSSFTIPLIRLPKQLLHVAAYDGDEFGIILKKVPLLRLNIFNFTAPDQRGILEFPSLNPDAYDKGVRPFFRLFHGYLSFANYICHGP